MIDMYWRPLVVGALSYVPGVTYLKDRFRAKGTGGTDSALYCYGVWLKHLTIACASGMPAIPRTVAELGPGDSIGTGLAAMLCGAEHYLALDVVEFSNISENLQVFDELVALFRARADRPQKGWPDFDVYMNGRLFPNDILSPEVLRRSLADERVEAIRRRIMDRRENSLDLSVEYIVPWHDPSVIRKESVDLVLSHSCLEHVDDLDSTYEAMALWLRPGGYMSHQIDYTCHGLSKHWDGYRTCPDWLWRVIRHRRTFLINREPHSGHLRRLRKHGLDIVRDLRLQRTEDSVGRTAMCRRFHSLDDADLYCASGFVQARK